ncbi:carbon-nitrogen hydrolase family protein [Pseudomonas sessilinigenes]|uniref:Carbon-nitrogen hydrolase family protein n=1 Tax=Pseudomonas sessilinigenes TaxID=658629 RepID=A0ABX8MHW6_9PSED|nr:carbon-nitrogen hydrolase family protein [Pseudomonas sessilinigenes]AZC27183.1 Hydrolase, carbon-nitrogen family [Pseudomonas sessilinigenes]QXH38883.1 carbon-nitrogen hydrolase family protein [Pseudomonas sessilinigenes]
MTLLTLAAAQSESIAGDLPANLTGHQRLMCLAAQQGVQLLVFPELSLTGYEPQLAAELAVAPDSPVLQPVRDLARELHMTTVVGMPIRLVDGGPVLIGALVLGADGSLAVYSKQHLHPGEERAFAAGRGGAPLAFAEHQIALAVCADFSHASHVQAAAQAGAAVYAAGVLISEGGYAVDSALLQGYAGEHGLLVLMANHGGPSGGWTCAGRSAAWGPTGELLAAVEGTGEALLIVRGEAGRWQAEVLPLER